MGYSVALINLGKYLKKNLDLKTVFLELIQKTSLQLLHGIHPEHKPQVKPIKGIYYRPNNQNLGKLILEKLP